MVVQLKLVRPVAFGGTRGTDGGGGGVTFAGGGALGALRNPSFKIGCCVLLLLAALLAFCWQKSDAALPR